MRNIMSFKFGISKIEVSGVQFQNEIDFNLKKDCVITPKAILLTN